MIAARADPLTDEQRDLAASEAVMAASMGRRFARYYEESDREPEFVSAAYEGLIEAARKFDAARDPRFRSFAEFKIRWAICKMRERNRRPKHRLGVRLGGLDRLIHDPRPGPSAEPDRVEAWDHALQDLSCREWAIVVGHYFGGLDVCEIGRALGVKAARSTQIHKAALAKLRGRGEELRALCAKANP